MPDDERKSEESPGCVHTCFHTHDWWWDKSLLHCNTCTEYSGADHSDEEILEPQASPLEKPCPESVATHDWWWEKNWGQAVTGREQGRWWWEKVQAAQDHVSPVNPLTTSPANFIICSFRGAVGQASRYHWLQLGSCQSQVRQLPNSGLLGLPIECHKLKLKWH